MVEMGFLYLCFMGATYIAGGVAYAARVPERFFPGKKKLNKKFLILIFFYVRSV
jgi:hypothetical protein